MSELPNASFCLEGKSEVNPAWTCRRGAKKAWRLGAGPVEPRAGNRGSLCGPRRSELQECQAKQRGLCKQKNWEIFERLCHGSGNQRSRGKSTLVICLGFPAEIRKRPA